MSNQRKILIAQNMILRHCTDNSRTGNQDMGIASFSIGSKSAKIHTDFPKQQLEELLHSI